MNFTVELKSLTFNQTSQFRELVQHIRRCIHHRAQTKEQQHYMKIYSITHYVEQLRRVMNENPLLTHSKLSLDEKTSVDNLYTIEHDTDLKSDLSKISLTFSQSNEEIHLRPTKSTTHYIQPTNISEETSGLLTKATLAAIDKATHQRSSRDIQILEHLLNHCESFRYLPTHVRYYAARSLLLFTYPSNTIVTRQNCPSFFVYIIVSGQCKLLLETQETAIFGDELNIGDVYGDDNLEHHLNGLITNETTHCKFVIFSRRDIRAYDNSLSDMMKQSLLEQLRAQSTFIALHWRDDIFEYFLKWSKYKQYLADEIIYGNEKYQHDNLYFILHGQISFICLLDFPLMVIEHPQLSELYQTWNHSEHKMESKARIHKATKGKTAWRFLDIFNLSNGHYFGFESTTTHAWYLARTIVDIISIPKIRFKELGHFAPMIFEKLRVDFLDIYPNENFIRNSFIKYLRTNKSNENELLTMKFSNQKQRIVRNNDNNIKWIPEQNLLSM
ncbi:hypothetical protein I4U23_008069 [Adineta vaga]|nr:hypothetical protein I4U23_008069 [Adineta vaga]